MVWAITVDAGPDKIIAFPSNDLSIFGHVTNSQNTPLNVQWTQVSGPGTVVFSAPWALITTASFTTTGSYVFRLTVSDGTPSVSDTMTATVNPASSQSAFYVDPSYSGATQNGGASTPWKSFEDGNTNQDAQWSAINNALTSNDVIVYFSARQAGSNSAEEIVGFVGPGSVVRVRRTDTSTHRLTLDGMSKYNTNDASPLWADYTGTSKMRLRMTGGCCMSIGWDDDTGKNYVTIRGFEVTGSGARVRWGGDYSYLEYMWVHDVTSLGATVQYNQAVGENGHGCPAFGNDHDITVRNNIIERTIGEALYMSGNYLQVKYGGCPSYGNTHSDILIEGNTISESGINGDEGDGIDLKGGLMDVTLRNNVISNTHGGGTCIVSEGVFPPARTDYLIEGNRCTNIEGWGMIALMAQSGTIIRNNVLNGGNGLVITEQDPGIYPNKNIQVYNNVLYNAGGIGADTVTNLELRNNLLISSGGIGWSAVTGASSDYNFFAPSGSSTSEGSHSIVQSSTSGIVVNAAGGDFHLTSTSPAKDKGVSLTSFNVDFAKTLRPQGSAWDIGAYEFVGTGADTTPPTLSNGQPSSTLPSGTTSTTMSVTTNENANCKYSTTANVAYSSMTNTFSTTGGTIHSSLLTGLANGQTYTRYVRCQDTSGNANTNDFIVSFSVANPAFDFSLSNGGSKTITQGSSTTNTITSTLLSGTSQSVSFSSSGFPTGATSSFSPVSCSPTCTTSMTINTINSTPSGNYTINVNGNGGGLIRTTNFRLTVNPIITISCSWDFFPRDIPDGKVTLGDVLVVVGDFGKTSASPGFNSRMDFNNNNQIDLFDVLSVVAHFGGCSG